jgi:hypothetical protein
MANDTIHPFPKPKREHEPMPDYDAEGEAHRRRVTLIAAGVAVILLGIGYVVVDRFLRNEETQKCFALGRKNCTPIELPPVSSKMP